MVLGAVALVILGGPLPDPPALPLHRAWRGCPRSRPRRRCSSWSAIALMMGALGLSPALGSFLAGVVLANSEYRHALESDIAPFKGLLLGLFFITVGAGIDLRAAGGGAAAHRGADAGADGAEGGGALPARGALPAAGAGAAALRARAGAGGRVRLLPARLRRADRGAAGRGRGHGAPGGVALDVPDPGALPDLRPAAAPLRRRRSGGRRTRSTSRAR